MEEQISSLLHELEEWGRENDEREQDRSNKMLNLEPDTAQLISMLIRSGQRKHLLEV